MDNFGVIIWLVVIVSWVIKFIGRLSADGKSSDKRKGLEKKVTDFFSDKFTQEEQKKTTTKEQLSNTSSNLDDKWVPAYEESPENDDRPLEKTGNINNYRTNLDKTGLKEKLSQKRNNLDRLELDDEITSRNGVSVVKKTNNAPVLENKDKNDAYSQDKIRDGSPLNGDSFSRDDLIKGVIFKEILDLPRSKRPYKPFDRIR